MFAGLAVIAIPAAGRSGYKPVLAVQTYIWEQYFSRRKSTLAGNLEEAFAATRRAGFRRLECTERLFVPETIGKTQSLLRKYGLEAPIISANKLFHEEGSAEQGFEELLQLVRGAKPLGVKAVSFNPLRKEKKELKTPAELETQARYINRLARELHSLGVRLMLHQHDAEMRDNAREWRHWLHNTDPEFTSFCLDADWVVRGGQDPMALLREAGGRVASLHIRSGQNGIWMEELGEGDPDYRPIAAHLKQSGFQGFLVVELAYEQKTAVTRSLEENLRRSRVWAERIFAL